MTAEQEAVLALFVKRGVPEYRLKTGLLTEADWEIIKQVASEFRKEKNL